MQKKFGGLNYLSTFGLLELKHNEKDINELQIFSSFIFIIVVFEISGSK